VVTTKLALGEEIEVLQKQRRVKQDRKNLKERRVLRESKEFKTK
jgi:hypothetical protein